MRGFILGAVLAGSACQPAAPPPEPTPAPAATSASIDQKPEVIASAIAELPAHMWGISDSGKLMFAPFPSGDIHIAMTCQPNGDISIWVPNPEEDGQTLRLVSGEESEAFPATRIPADDEGFEGVASRIEIKASTRVLQAFRESGQLSRGQTTDVMNAKTPQEKEAIESFFAGCEAARG